MLTAMPLSSKALERRGKKFLRRNEIKLYTSVLPGLEALSASEVAALAENLSVGHGGVEFTGNLNTIYLANLTLRAANRVLLRLAEFSAHSYPMLYDHARKVDWAAILGNCLEVSVKASSRRSRLRQDAHIREVVHDAIEARLSALGMSTSLADEAPLTVYVRLDRDRCTLSLDTTGVHLHKRGYRVRPVDAPIRETIAAGLLLAAQAKHYDVVVDPFCGSGTFLIEADFISRDFPPGIAREFAIEQSPLNAPARLRYLKRQLLARAPTKSSQRIQGFDVSADAVSAALANIEAANSFSISVATANALDIDYQELAAQSESRLVVANLPYGRRLGTTSEAQSLADEFADALARHARGWDFLLVAPAHIHIDSPALHTTKLVHFRNGGIKTTAMVGHVR